MIRGKRSIWLSGIGGAVLIGGLVLTNYGGGVSPVEAHNQHNQYQNPFRQILDKLNLILEKLNAGGGGSGAASVAGNYTTRWDTSNPSTARFTAAFPGAVLDNNTGLVWEQSPDATTRNWVTATDYCVNKLVGNTTGWRLPSVMELTSVLDASPGAVAPFVPATVFSGVQSANYWSTTAVVGGNSSAPTNLIWTVSFNDSITHAVTSPKSGTSNVWCVRGPTSVSAY